MLSGALAGKGGKWNDKTLDKWLKSPADYAPGKLTISNEIDAKRKRNLEFVSGNEKRHQFKIKFYLV